MPEDRRLLLLSGMAAGGLHLILAGIWLLVVIHWAADSPAVYEVFLMNEGRESADAMPSRLRNNLRIPGRSEKVFRRESSVPAEVASTEVPASEESRALSQHGSSS